jgi:hypothetical protein
LEDIPFRSIYLNRYIKRGIVGEGLAIFFSCRETADLLRRLWLAIEAKLFPHRDDRIADLVDGALQLASCHSEMFKPATNFGLILRGDMAAVALALAGKNIAHRLPRLGSKQ